MPPPCPVCARGDVRALKTARALFHRCPRCSFVFRDPRERPDDESARARYALHRNSPADSGYLSFLTGILDRALDAAGAGVRRAVDWGSGPTPVCADLLRARGVAVDAWDPHFAAGAAPPGASYDLALCVEVAEHFFDPSADFAALASRLKPGGLLALHTHMVPDSDADFMSWWYKEDITHVSFYSEQALRRLALADSLAPLSFERGRLALFRRPLPVLVAGGANWDAEGTPFAPLVAGDSNPGSVRFFPGGAARNVAEDLSRLSVPVEFVSIVGKDPAGKAILDSCARAGIGAAGVAEDERLATSTYLSILDSRGETALALAGMGLFESFGPREAIAAAERAAESARSRSFLPAGCEAVPFSLLALDGNLRPEVLEALLSRFPMVPSWLDPVSAAKASRIGAYRGGGLLGRFSGMKPNLAEAEKLLGAAAGSGAMPDRARSAAEALRLRGAGTIYVSMGDAGVLWADGPSKGIFVPPPVRAVSTTGAGDAFLASAARSAVLGRRGGEEAVRASAAAAIALMSEDACPRELSGAALESLTEQWLEGAEIDG